MSGGRGANQGPPLLHLQICSPPTPLIGAHDLAGLKHKNPKEDAQQQKNVCPDSGGGGGGARHAIVQAKRRRSKRFGRFVRTHAAPSKADGQH